jgi:hypothetical protein
MVPQGKRSAVASGDVNRLAGRECKPLGGADGVACLTSLRSGSTQDEETIKTRAAIVPALAP